MPTFVSLQGLQVGSQWNVLIRGLQRDVIYLTELVGIITQHYKLNFSFILRWPTYVMNGLNSLLLSRNLLILISI
jgi:hypothetical protein